MTVTSVELLYFCNLVNLLDSFNAGLSEEVRARDQDLSGDGKGKVDHTNATQSQCTAKDMAD